MDNLDSVKKLVEAIRFTGNYSKLLLELHNRFVHFIPLEHYTDQMQNAAYFLHEIAEYVGEVEKEIKQGANK